MSAELRTKFCTLRLLSVITYCDISFKIIDLRQKVEVHVGRARIADIWHLMCPCYRKIGFRVAGALL